MCSDLAIDRPRSGQNASTNFRHVPKIEGNCFGLGESTSPRFYQILGDRQSCVWRVLELRPGLLAMSRNLLEDWRQVLEIVNDQWTLGTICSAGNFPLHSTPSSHFAERCRKNKRAWQDMGMGQNLLVSILMGWTSIYQLFCGSLGTRVMTHSRMASYVQSFSNLSGRAMPSILCACWMTV